MGLYENIRDTAKLKGISINQIEKDLSLPRSSIAKYNAHVPSADKLISIAHYLGVSVESLASDKDSTEENKYYFDDNSAAIAQDIYDNPRLRALMDAARDCDPEDLKMAADMLLKFKRTNPNG